MVKKTGSAKGETLNGTGGIDSLYGRGGNDTLYGLAAADLLSGGAGEDKLYGGAGNDTLFGGLGDDTLFGGVGNDTLFGGAGSDIINGGAGLHDLVSYANAAEATTPGQSVDIFGRAIGVTGVLIDLKNHLVEEYAAGTVDTISGVEDIIGSEYGDMILGDNAANTIRTGGGLMYVGTSSYSNFVTAGGGNDKIFGSGYLFGGDGDDTITLEFSTIGAGNFVNGDFGSDKIIGSGSASERIQGGSGSDWIRGGAGGDLLYGDGRDNLLTVAVPSSDTFVFDDGDGFFGNVSAATWDDRVVDFQDGLDTFDLTAVDSHTAHLTAYAADSNHVAGVEVAYGVGGYFGFAGVFFVEGATLATLTQADFVGVTILP